MGFFSLLDPSVHFDARQPASPRRSCLKQLSSPVTSKTVRFEQNLEIHHVESYAEYDLWKDTKDYTKNRDLTLVRYSKVAYYYFVMYEEGKEYLSANGCVTAKQQFHILTGIQCDYRGVERFHDRQSVLDICHSIVEYQHISDTSDKELADFARILTLPDTKWSAFIGRMDAMVVNNETPLSVADSGLSRKRLKCQSPGDNKPTMNPRKHFSKPPIVSSQQYVTDPKQLSSPPKPVMMKRERITI